MTDDLTPERIQRNLDSAIVGRTIEQYAQTGSTNDLIRRQAHAGHPEGLVILADEQTAGRGRMGRAWAAPPSTSLLLSLLLRPTWLAPDDAFSLTMLAAVALCEAVEQVAPPRAALKWPNDLLLPVRTAAGPALRKAAGILSEIELAGDRIDWVVIGMGVNVSWSPSGIVDGRDLAEMATSISAAAGRPVERLPLLRALLECLDAR
jgi:BirA family biotin operon repressor/biotin-[acetyl-CoA-carboxylase] ligase